MTPYTRWMSGLAALAMLALVMGCPNAGDPPGPGDEAYADMGPYLAVVTLENGNFIAHVDNLGIGTLTLSDSYEVGGSFYFKVYDDIVWVYPQWGSGGNEILRFEITDEGLEPLETWVLPAGAGPVALLFVDSATAYLSLNEIGQLIEFDPGTLETTYTWDLSEYAIDDDDPETPEDLNPDPTSLTMRGDQLVVALGQYNSPYSAHMGLSALFIDTVTREVDAYAEELDTDYAWTGIPGLWHGNFVDENGDTYFQVQGAWGFIPGVASGYVRIKAGENDFDTSWDMKLSDMELDVPGGAISYVYRGWYAGDGIVYASVVVPALESNPPDYINDKAVMIVAIDLWNDTVEVLPFPATNSYAAAVFADGDKVVAAMQTDQGNGVYVYDTTDGSISEEPVMWIEGTPTCMLPVQEGL